MAPNLEKEGAGLDERQRVLIHACSLNRSDIIKKVVSTGTSPKSASSSSGSSGNGVDGDVDREVLDHVDEEGLTALHHAVKKSSLDAIRVLLRLGVDVTARGGTQSPFPNLTAYQVALSGTCKGNPEEIKQVFLTEAVQAIAAGDAERLRQFLEAGVEASSEYGAEGGGGEGGSTSLADWAEQLGQSEMLTALSASASTSPPEANSGTARDGGAAAPERGEQGWEGGWGGGELPDDVELFVEELRGAIVDLTAESEELEAELSQRGTLGIIKRARATRQDLILAASEVETANALCDKWRAEENAAATENARLQAEVVKAQLAVQRHRAGLADDDDAQDYDASAQGAKTPPSPTTAAAAGNNGGPGMENKDKDTSVSPQQPPFEGGGGSEGFVGAADGGGVGGHQEEGGAVEDKDSRKTEEAEALASQLQIIAMHLEDELRMMRSLINGEGAVGVVRRIRALREEIEAAEEEARQTYAVSRYLEARVIVLTESGDELFSQLDRLHGYLREPPGAALLTNADSSSLQPPSAANKEDVDDDAAAAGYYHHGPVLGARQGGEGEEDGVAGLRESGASHARSESGGESSASGGGGGGGGEAQGSGFRAPVDEHTEAVAARSAPSQDHYYEEGSTQQQQQQQQQQEQPQPQQGVGEGDSEGGAGAPESSVGAAEASESDDPRGDTDASSEDSAAGSSALSETEDSDATGGGPVGGKREGRARALLSAPGVDAASGVRGWRRRNGAGGGPNGGVGGQQKVTIVQDVLSVLFGWEVSSAADKKAALGGAQPGAGSGGAGAGVMFA
eukprot:g15249.t1